MGTNHNIQAVVPLPLQGITLPANLRAKSTVKREPSPFNTSILDQASDRLR